MVFLICWLISFPMPSAATKRQMPPAVCKTYTDGREEQVLLHVIHVSISPFRPGGGTGRDPWSCHHTGWQTWGSGASSPGTWHSFDNVNAFYEVRPEAKLKKELARKSQEALFDNFAGTHVDMLLAQFDET